MKVFFIHGLKVVRHRATVVGYIVPPVDSAQLFPSQRTISLIGNVGLILFYSQAGRNRCSA